MLQNAPFVSGPVTTTTSIEITIWFDVELRRQWALPEFAEITPQQ